MSLMEECAFDVDIKDIKICNLHVLTLINIGRSGRLRIRMPFSNQNFFFMISICRQRGGPVRRVSKVTSRIAAVRKRLQHHGSTIRTGRTLFAPH